MKLLIFTIFCFINLQTKLHALTIDKNTGMTPERYAINGVELSESQYKAYMANPETKDKIEILRNYSGPSNSIVRA